MLQVDPTAAQQAKEAIQQPKAAADVASALQAMLTLLQANFSLEEQLLTPGSLDVLLSYATEGNTAPVLSAAVQVARAPRRLGGD